MDISMVVGTSTHSEGTFGFIGKAVQQVLDAVRPEQARMTLGGTAIEVFNLD